MCMHVHVHVHACTGVGGEEEPQVPVRLEDLVLEQVHLIEEEDLRGGGGGGAGQAYSN